MMNKPSGFFHTIFFGKDPPEIQLKPAFQHQWQNVKDIWNNKYYKDFGIERLIRLFLALSQFAFPGLYIKAFIGRWGLVGRKLAVEFYVLVKLLLPIIFFKFGMTGQAWVLWLTIYIIVETMIYLACVIYLSDVFAKPTTYRRSLTLIFINYIEITLSYAVIYSYCNINIPHFFNHALTTNMQAIYFSFITSATVGFGDIYPVHDKGHFLVMTQLIVFIIFVGLYFNFFSSKVQDASYYKDDETS